MIKRNTPLDKNIGIVGVLIYLTGVNMLMINRYFLVIKISL